MPNVFDGGPSAERGEAEYAHGPVAQMNELVLWIGWATVAYGVWLIGVYVEGRVRLLLLLRKATYRAPRLEPEPAKKRPHPETLELTPEQKYGD